VFRAHNARQALFLSLSLSLSLFLPLRIPAIEARSCSGERSPDRGRSADSSAPLARDRLGRSIDDSNDSRARRAGSLRKRVTTLPIAIGCTGEG